MEKNDKRMDLTIRRLVKAEDRLEKTEESLRMLATTVDRFLKEQIVVNSDVNTKLTTLLKESE
jgi:hypothetical protein